MHVFTGACVNEMRLRAHRKPLSCNLGNLEAVSLSSRLVFRGLASTPKLSRAKTIPPVTHVLLVWNWVRLQTISKFLGSYPA